MSEDPFRKLVAILKKLRSPDGCPWDREQTFASLRPYLLEETYEILELIDQKHFLRLKEELGDLIMHTVFQAQIAAEMGLFDIDDVLQAINRKLIIRHPHVFADARVESARQVMENWEKIKLNQGTSSLLGGVPRSLPALLRAYRVQEKAAGVGFEWDDADGVLDKLREEFRELQEAKAKGDQIRISEEFGDVLFVLVNLARYWGVTPEEALRKTTEKFIQRFNYIEDKLKERGQDIQKATLKEMDALWEEAKKKGI